MFADCQNESIPVHADARSWGENESGWCEAHSCEEIIQIGIQESAGEREE